MKWLLPLQHFFKAGKLCRQCDWACQGLDLGDPGFAGLLGPRHHHRGLAGSRWWRRLVPSHSLGTGGRGGEWCSCFTPHLHTHLCPAPRTWVGRRGGRGRGCWCPNIRPPQLEVRSRLCSLDSAGGRLALQKQSLFCSLSLTYHTSLTLATNGHTVFSAGAGREAKVTFLLLQDEPRVFL